MFDICCIGHITLDKVVSNNSVKHMPGGTSYYFSNAIQNLDVSFALITALAESESSIVAALQQRGMVVTTLPSKHTVYFENTYSENQDHRTQRVLQQADPFSGKDLTQMDAKVYHLGPLLANDIPLEAIKLLSKKGLVSLDVQGYLRVVENKKVFYRDWTDKREALPYIHILKANEFEMEALTGTNNVQEGAKILAGWGVEEVVITLGSMGSVLYKDGIFFKIPAYKPQQITDATGCGDTYMAGYLYKRVQNSSLPEAGNFAAAMSTLKIENYGPFNGKITDVEAVLIRSKQENFVEK